MKNEFKNSSKNGNNNKVEISNNMYMKNKLEIETINIMTIPEEIQINKEDSSESNYIISTFNKNKLKNIFILILLPIIFIFDNYYRNKLYIYSLDLGISLQKYYSENLILLMKFITKFGCDYCCFIFLFFVFVQFSLIQSIIYFIGLIFCIYIQSLIKLIYCDSRPFLDNDILFKGICEGGFGNPSGHSLVSVFLYLTFFHYLIKLKYINDNKLLKFLLGATLSIITILILISRFILGLHSLNQIILGSFIGAWIFLFIFIIFKFDKITMITYRKLFNKKLYIFFISLSFLLFLYAPLLCLNKFHQNNNYIYLDEKLNYNCSYITKYKRFKNGGIFECLIIVCIIGFYYGQIIFWIVFDKYYKINLSENNNNYYLIDELLNKWNKNKCLLFDKKENIYIFLKAIVFCLSPLIVFFSVKSSSVSIILFFKFGLPLFLISLFLFSFGFYWLILIYLGNKEKILNNYYQLSIDDI